MSVKSTDQILTQLKDFEKIKANLMSEVSKDLDIIAWICWGLELYFKDFSYKQMLEYMKNSDREDIKKHISLVLTGIQDPTTIEEFDSMNIIKKKNDSKLVQTGLSIVNMLFYSRALLQYEMFQFSGMVASYVDREFTGNEPIEIPSMISLWILPNSGNEKRENVMFVSNLGNFEINKFSGAPYSSITTKETGYCYFPGNPSELNIDDGDEIPTKIRYLTLLLDCLFDHETSVEKKLEILASHFNLKSDKTENLVRNLTQLMIEVGEFSSGFAGNYETLEEKYEMLIAGNKTNLDLIKMIKSLFYSDENKNKSLD